MLIDMLWRLIMVSVLGLLLGAATVYKEVDEQGNIIFSDQAAEHAEKIQIDEPSVIDLSREDRGLVRPGPGSAATQDPVKEKPPVQYTELRITSPVEDSAIRENAGNVTVMLTIQPALAAGDKIEISLDGVTVASGRATHYTLTALDRGTHQLMARVVDSAGKTRIRSSTVSFHLLRISLRPSAMRDSPPRASIRILS